MNFEWFNVHRVECGLYCLVVWFFLSFEFFWAIEKIIIKKNSFFIHKNTHTFSALFRCVRHNKRSRGKKVCCVADVAAFFCVCAIPLFFLYVSFSPWKVYTQIKMERKWISKWLIRRSAIRVWFYLWSQFDYNALIVVNRKKNIIPIAVELLFFFFVPMQIRMFLILFWKHTHTRTPNDWPTK